MKKTRELQELISSTPLEQKQEKASYETPKLIVHGKVEKLTLQTVN